MGPKYSKGAKVVSPKLDRFRVMTMLEVRSKAILMSKLFGQKGLYFITHEQLTRIFQMSGDEIYLLERSFAANANMPRINSLDFFCALALAASGANDDKLTFCCKIMDTNGDDKLSYHEVIILFICATRGIASLKGLEYIPEATLDKVVMDAFSTHQHALKDNGEMLISTLTTFILNHELCRAYLVSLGAKIPPVDTNAMVSKRTFFMKELVSTRCQIEEVIMAMQDLSESQALFGERGGDIDYLKMSSQPFITPSLPSNNPQNAKNAANNTIPSLLLRDPSHPVNKYFQFDNSWTAEKFAEIPFPPHFAVEATTRYEIDHKLDVDESSSVISKDLTNTENVNQSIFAQAFANKLKKSWNKLPHDCADMSVVDAFTIIAIFQELDIKLPFSFANQCIMNTSKSQFGKVKFSEVLHYFRLFYNPSRRIDFGGSHDSDMDAKKIDVFGHTLTHYFASYRQTYHNVINTIQRQRRILQGFEKANVVNLAKKLADFRSMSMKRPSIANLQFYFNESQITSRAPKEDERVKLHELYIYQTKIRVNITTNPFNNLSTKRPKESSRIHLIPDTDSMNKGKMMFVVEDSEELTASDFLDFYNLLQEKEDANPPPPPPAPTAVESDGKSKANSKKKKVYNSVIFSTIDLQDNLDYSQALILQKALFHFFTAISLHFRQDWYTDVKVEIFTKVLEAPTATTNAATSSPTKKASFFKSAKSRLSSQANINNLTNNNNNNNNNNNKKKKKKMSIFIALLHEHDHFAEIEKQLLEADIYLSRCLHNFDMTLDISQSLSDIFLKCLSFHNLSEKLFGPQEDELGEEGSNPLRFAKEMRRKKHTFQDILSRIYPPNTDEMPSTIMNEGKNSKNVSLLTREEIMSLCREHGVKDQGSSLAQLQTRMMRLFQQKLELLGHGEMSEFGRHCVCEMVRKMKKRNALRHTHATTTSSSNNTKKQTLSPNKTLATLVDNENSLSLTLWEMNDLLLTICNTQTFYSKVEYAGFLHEHELLYNRDMELTAKGLQHYYEANGGLLQDLCHSSILGSLDSNLAGRMTINSTFDSDALASITNLLPSNPLFIPTLFQFLLHISTLKEVKLDGKVDQFSDIFTYLFNHFFTSFPWHDVQLEKMKASLSNLSTFPEAIVEFCEDIFRQLGDVKEGIIPAIRRHLATCDKISKEDKESSKSTASKTGKDLKQEKSTSKDTKREEEEVKEEYVDYAAIFGGQQYLDKVYEEIEKVMEILAVQRKQQQQQEKLDAEKEAQRRQQENEQGQPASTTSTTATAVSNPEEVTATLEGDDSQQQQAQLAQQLQQQKQRDKEAAYEQELLFLQLQAKVKLHIMQQHATCTLPTLLILSTNTASAIKTDFTDPDTDFNSLNSEFLEEDIEQVDFHKLRQEIVENLIFLNNIRTVENLNLSLQESKLVEEKKVELQQKLQVLNQQELKFETQFLRHVLAAYDALRLFGSTVTSIGIGTKDCCGRLTLEGFPLFATMFPSGSNGEKSFVQQQTDEKKMRFENRKNLALAALERERLRRQLTDEDIERIRKEKLQKQKIKYEKEEMKIFQFAVQQLEDSRRNKKTMFELASMIKKFEGVLKLKESRFPCELPAQVMKSNIACLLYEVYGLDHPLCEPAQYLLQDACEHLLTLEEPELEEPTEDADNHNKDEESTAYDAESQAGSKLSSNDTNSHHNNKIQTTINEEEDGMPRLQIVIITEQQQKRINNASIKILIVLHYLHILNENHAYSAIKQAQPYKLYLHQCYNNESSCLHLLSIEEKQAVLDINKVDLFYCGGVALFRLKDFHPWTLLESTLQEVDFILASNNEDDENDENSSIASQTRVSQAEINDVNEQEALLQDTANNPDTISVTSSQQHREQERLDKLRRQEKREKYEEQRRKDVQRRSEVAKQRNMLYKLIQSDQISDIFAARAGHMKSLSAPSWNTEGAGDGKKDEAAEEFNELANMVADQESRRLKVVAASQEENEKKQKEAESSTQRRSGTSPTSRSGGRK